LEIDLSEMYCDVMEMMESGQDRRRRRRKGKKEEMVQPWCCASLGVVRARLEGEWFCRFG
tara:strand:+ start:657 stop:836 length:180 start_codon:yes stop_codon:yes gene_type:complete